MLATAATEARDLFIQLNGLPFLVDVLGSCAGNEETARVVENVCFILLSLSSETHGAHLMIRSLPAASKQVIKQALQDHDDHFSERWLEQKGSTLLRAALNAGALAIKQRPALRSSGHM